jgi:hypothetical protein
MNAVRDWAALVGRVLLALVFVPGRLSVDKG